MYPAADHGGEAYEDQVHTSPIYLAPLGTRSNCIKCTVTRKKQETTCSSLVDAGTYSHILLSPKKWFQIYAKYIAMIRNSDGW